MTRLHCGPLHTQNWGKLQTGLVVWLDMEVDDIVARLSKDPEEVAKRPLLQGGDVKEKLTAIYEERKPMYQQASQRLVQRPCRSRIAIELAWPWMHHVGRTTTLDRQKRMHWRPQHSEHTVHVHVKESQELRTALLLGGI